MKIKEIVLSTILILVATNAHSLVINGTNDIDIYGSEGLVSVYDSATITTHVGSSVAFLDGYDNSTFNINGGDISWLELYDSNITNIAYVEDLSWLLVSDNSTVNIFGSDFNYYSGHLSGTWGDGTAFSFWALEELDLHSGNIGNVLPDNIILHADPVPEPSSLALLAIGVACLVFRKNII